MSTLALSRFNGYQHGVGSPAAGDDGHRLDTFTRSIRKNLRAGITARSSWVFNDLHLLAVENAVTFEQSRLFVLAQQFLLCLPSNFPPPELALDNDGEIVFDWRGSGGKLLSITLRGDGRLCYAARFTSCDNEYGTKLFSDAISKPIIELVQRVTAP